MMNKNRKLQPSAILLILPLVFALLLCGCGGTSTAPAATSAPSPAPTEAAEETAAPVATLPGDALKASADTETETAEDSGGSADQALLDAAAAFIDKPLAELTAEIGEPLSSSYVSSCLVPGAQDGELRYDGFSVFTLKDGDSETVKDVIAD